MKYTLCLMFLVFGLQTTMAEYWQGVASASPPFNYTCYPNSTIVVDNTNVNGFQTSFANDTVRVCTTTYNAAYTVLSINGCDLDDDILLVFTNRTEDFDDIIGGFGVDAYIIRCNDIPDTGFNRTVIQEFSPTLSAARVSSVSPTVYLQSAIREHYRYGSPEVHTAVLTTRLYWTIDVPDEYFVLPTFCYVVSGTDAFSITALRKNIIADGCSEDTDLVGHFVWKNRRTPYRRSSATFHVFKFYDSNYITFHCNVQICRFEIDCTAVCGKRKRRAAPLGHVEEHSSSTTLKIFSLSGAPRIVPGAVLCVSLLYFLV